MAETSAFLYKAKMSVSNKRQLQQINFLLLSKHFKSSFTPQQRGDSGTTRKCLEFCECYTSLTCMHAEAKTKEKEGLFICWLAAELTNT